ncbi:MAG: ABC transporter substrate-binding protein, partial [Desulfatiglandales bacterium]
ARAMAGTMIQEWLQEIGIDVTVKPMPFNAMMDQVKSRKEFDMVIMGYGNLTLDPDYLRRFFESEAGGHKGDNITGYSSQSFDQLARASSGCMDPEERRKIVCQMQRILSEELPIIPLYNPYVIEVVREDKFTGWVKTLGGVGNLWSFFNLRPAKGK